MNVIRLMSHELLKWKGFCRGIPILSYPPLSTDEKKHELHTQVGDRVCTLVPTY